MFRIFSYMRGLNTQLLNMQIEVFLAWAIPNRIATENFRPWLNLFVSKIGKRDVMEIKDEDVDVFLGDVYAIENTSYRKNEAKRAIQSFRRFYMARSKNGKTRMGAGRPPKQEGIDRVRELRSLKEPMSFREIARALNQDVRQVYRWWKYTRDANK